MPILSYVQAGTWREMCEQATAFDGSLEYVEAGVSVGDCAFGLWVRGNSMEPEFKEGDLLIVDPDEAPHAGSYVVAKNGHEEATFKKYRSRGEYADGRARFELVPLNDDHQTLSTDETSITIIGVVVEHRRIFKRTAVKS
ncbi:MAG: LexA family protein [Aeromonas sp.]